MSIRRRTAFGVAGDVFGGVVECTADGVAYDVAGGAVSARYMSLGRESHPVRNEGDRGVPLD
jgi:hypothetical protein